jgi:hypothetical protein
LRDISTVPSRTEFDLGSFIPAGDSKLELPLGSEGDQTQVRNFPGTCQAEVSLKYPNYSIAVPGYRFMHVPGECESNCDRIAGHGQSDILIL